MAIYKVTAGPGGLSAECVSSANLVNADAESEIQAHKLFDQEPGTLFFNAYSNGPDTEVRAQWIVRQITELRLQP